MGAKKKKRDSNRVWNAGKVLEGVFNSDEWHQLFDLFNYFEESIADSKRRETLLAAVDAAIQKTFGKGGEAQGFRSEAAFVLKRLHSKIYGWVVGGKPVHLEQGSAVRAAPVPRQSC